MDAMMKIGMVCQGLEASEYRCQESIAQWGGYFLTLKGPQHDEAWLIFMDMVNKQLPTYEDKAEALFFFPNFRPLVLAPRGSANSRGTTSSLRTTA